MVAFFCILESMKHSFTPISKIGRTAVLQKRNEFQGASSIPINLFGAEHSRIRGYMRKVDARYQGTERIREVEYQRLFDLDASIIEEQVFGGEWEWQQSDKEIQQDFVRRMSSVGGMGYWFRQKGTVVLPLKRVSELNLPSIIIGVDFEQEDQRRRRVGSDSLISPSQRFWSVGPSITGQHTKWDWKASWMLREEDYSYD
mgnify:CR=1 FL=1